MLQAGIMGEIGDAEGEEKVAVVRRWEGEVEAWVKGRVTLEIE